MMGGMGRAELPDLGDHRVVVSLPAADADDLVAACEVLWQEGHRLWSLPVETAGELPGLKRVFGRRARIGVHGVVSAREAADAASGGADLVASIFCLPDVVAAAGDVPTVLGGLTPQELWNAHGAGASAVQVVPCEAFGTAYARSLPELVAEIPLLAAGRLEHYQAESWLSAGALGVWPTALVTQDLVVDTDLGGLRALCQRWRLGDG
jgi:2-dehydro-3-deoxyphosphogluconate aldolase/(4S)-4-hydroxy-2-oxoglutarate aldolase